MNISSCYEVEIVWEVDVAGLPYVREYVEQFASDRQRPVSWRGGGRRVGYSVLAPDAPRHPGTDGFVRRVFWLSDDDPYPSWPWVPVEAVDPRTVRPNATSAHVLPSEFEQSGWHKRSICNHHNQAMGGQDSK
jgi:hypothetical protein